MGTVPVEAGAAAYFAALDSEMGQSMARVGKGLQKLPDRWSGDAADYFHHVLTDWHTAYTGLFGDEDTKAPGLLGEIAHLMDVPWYDHSMPVTNNGLPGRVLYDGTTPLNTNTNGLVGAPLNQPPDQKQPQPPDQPQPQPPDQQQPQQLVALRRIKMEDAKLLPNA